MSESLLREFARLEEMTAAFIRKRELQRAFDELSRLAARLPGHVADTTDINGLEHDDEGKFTGEGGGGKKEKTGSGNPEKNTGRSRNSAPVSELSGNELGQKEGESLKEAAHRYYETLRKNPANREGFGEVRFTRAGRNKLDSTTFPEPERLKLLPAVKSIIEKGDYIGGAKSSRERKDGMVAFHYFEGNVTLGKEKKFIGISVGEDSRGNKFYNLTESPDTLLKKKKARESAEDTARGLVPSSKGSASDASAKSEALNLIIM